MAYGGGAREAVLHIDAARHAEGGSKPPGREPPPPPATLAQLPPSTPAPPSVGPRLREVEYVSDEVAQIDGHFVRLLEGSW